MSSAKTVASISNTTVRAGAKAEEHAALADLIGRKSELQRVRTAIRNRESFLIYGPADVGKTSLVKCAIAELPEKDRKRCVYWSGEASVRQLAEELLRALYAAEDRCVRGKVREFASGREIEVDRWFRNQTSGQLKALLYIAAAKGRYAIFLDHMPRVTQSMARFLKEIIWRCKTPVYLLARGCDRREIGHAWSIYFTKEYRIEIGPLTEPLTRELLERCIHHFRLDRFDVTGFQDEILRLSGRLPGAVTRMCELATHRRYHYGDQIKVNLLHVDYLMFGDRLRDPRCAL